jgi:hypothetical protein
MRSTDNSQSFGKYNSKIRTVILIFSNFISHVSIVTKEVVLRKTFREFNLEIKINELIVRG